MSFSVFEIAFVAVTINRCKYTFAMTLIISKLAFVEVTVDENFLTLPFLFAILELANVFSFDFVQ